MRLLALLGAAYWTARLSRRRVTTRALSAFRDWNRKPDSREAYRVLERAFPPYKRTPEKPPGGRKIGA